MISGWKGERRSEDTTGLYFLIYFPKDTQLHTVINKLASSEISKIHVSHKYDGPWLSHYACRLRIDACYGRLLIEHKQKK